MFKGVRSHWEPTFLVKTLCRWLYYYQRRVKRMGAWFTSPLADEDLQVIRNETGCENQ